jgi:cephalosporin-C deacetylase-like acetyl esterase
MKKGFIFLILLCSTVQKLFPQANVEREKQYLQEILKINIKQVIKENTRRVTLQDSTWDDWLKRTGELPPDFSTMPSWPMLPEPLVLYKNRTYQPVTSISQWEEKRRQIKEDYIHWIAGSFPPAPQNLKTEIISDREEEGTRIQLIQLRFGPGQQARMTFELIIPEGKGPFPVFMTQWTHRGWAQLAVKRGYIACVYAAADTKDDTQAYQALYPEYDFSMLMRRAWGASRVVDYLITRPEVNKKQLSISGHSRNGKQSLWATAFDDRIAAVVSSSSGTGGDAPWRFGDPQYASETLDYVTALNGHWFHPRLRFFFGREDKLPVDQNLLGALIAPRGLLYHYSIVEHGLNPWANEQNYYSVKKVYDFLKAPANIGVLTRMGEHAVAARDIEKTIDFLDGYFKRKNITWQNQLYYPYDYLAWEKSHPKDKEAAAVLKPVQLGSINSTLEGFQASRKRIADNLQWLLGKEPSGLKAAQVSIAEPSRYDWIDKTIGRPEVPGTKAIYLGPYTAIGDHVPGILYQPVDKDGKLMTRANGKMPVVIYAHQYAYATGYAKGYDPKGSKGNVKLFRELTKRGFAVLAIDMFGFGARIEEATNFYLRYPEWSLMGKMIRDMRGCIDAVENLSALDSKHIYLFGNTIGGSVSLLTAALDNRVAGVATVAAFSPWRTSNSQYESIRNYSHLHGFIPRLGLFAGNPAAAPVDFGEIISLMAPKPLLIIAPDLDRYTDIPSLKKAVEPVVRVYQLYKEEDQLVLKYPHEINRIPEDMYLQIGNFYSSLLN